MLRKAAGVLVDGKRVELGLWRDCAEAFVGPSITDAITTLKALQAEMDERYDMLLSIGQRTAGIIVVAATQRPSSDIVLTSLRDLFGYRWAFRCSTHASSDVILGHGWANEGFTAASIDPATRGVGWLIAEGGIPRRLKSAFLTDDQVGELAEHAAALRGDLP
jgi:S-DNA-T family DNA segregation ATPase FtsK/SpoIIIE